MRMETKRQADGIVKEVRQLLEPVQTKPYYGATKRLVDLVFASFGIILLGWLFALTALLIKLEDPKGPVFFKQTRCGKGGTPFTMYKFRSMAIDAEARWEALQDQNEVSGLMFKMAEDPRVTRVGRWIRKTSIDELPQLWNVIKGDMSLVGPRPPLPREVKYYSDYHMQRLNVKPGCSGLWQATARNSVGFEEMVQLDLLYIQTRSTLLDMKIIVWTCLNMVLKRDAS
jgi:lipopolysaccharide/colanic/teichoic acid biosynthesis glycosyltransferase